MDGRLVLVIGLLVAISSPCISGQTVTFVAKNLAGSTAGGQRFNTEVGLRGALKDLTDALGFIYSVLYNGDASIPRKSTNRVTFSLDIDTSASGFVAYTVGGNNNDAFIHLSNKYVADYTEGPLGREVRGVLYHESTHVWQWNGRGTAPGGLIEGIADYIRLRAGLAPGHWIKPGGGDRWDEGYDVTAYFLQYCESLRPGFVRAVNGKLARETWSLNYFQELLGQSVDQLWSNYKKKYNGHLSY